MRAGIFSAREESRDWGKKGSRARMISPELKGRGCFEFPKSRETREEL
jgi:hypothetical protein